MTDLIAALERAKFDGSGDKPGISEYRLFDGRIEFALHGEKGRLYSDVQMRGLVARNDCPHFTASIDAALTLVPKGWSWLIRPSDFQDNWIAEVWRGDDDGRGSRATTPALAICIAALRAKGTDDAA